MIILVKCDYEALSVLTAQIIVSRISTKKNLVLGLPTGKTPLGLYQNLSKMYQAKLVDFSRVTVFSLDEYVGIPRNHPASFHFFLWSNLLKHINLNPNRFFSPDGAAKDMDTESQKYENKIRLAEGLDLVILGIGENGHIGFNEPGSSLASKTRVKTLKAKTRKANTWLFNSVEQVPQYGISMGIGTIMQSKELIVIANGPKKARAIKKMVTGPITAQFPASIIQMHPKAAVIIDKTAGALLNKDLITAPQVYPDGTFVMKSDRDFSPK